MSRGAAVAAAGLAAALLAAGCGEREQPNIVQGKAQFVQKCGSCHALARAGTKGVQGPNLDAAFVAARRSGFGQDTFEGVVYDQIQNVRKGSIMQPNLVTGEARRDVAAYVAMVAGRPGEDQGILAKAGQPKVSNKPIVATNGLLKIAADPTGALAFASTRAEAPAGSIEFEMDNPASIDHNIAVKDGSVDEKGPVVGKGGKSTFTADLQPGQYTFYCSVPGHEAGGMKGTLTVK